MNPRTFHKDGRYYDLEPSWYFESWNVIQRIFNYRKITINFMTHSKNSGKCTRSVNLRG